MRSYPVLTLGVFGFPAGVHSSTGKAIFDFGHPRFSIRWLFGYTAGRFMAPIAQYGVLGWPKMLFLATKEVIALKALKVNSTHLAVLFKPPDERGSCKSI